MVKLEEDRDEERAVLLRGWILALEHVICYGLWTAG